MAVKTERERERERERQTDRQTETETDCVYVQTAGTVVDCEDVLCRPRTVLE